MCRVDIRQTTKYRTSTTSPLKRLDLQSTDPLYPRRPVRWVGHVSRIPISQNTRRLLTGLVSHSKPAGSPLMDLGRTLKKALKKPDLPTALKGWSASAPNHNTWRAELGCCGTLSEPHPNTYREKWERLFNGRPQ